MAKGFHDFEQKELTVDEYLTKFTRLSLFAPYLVPNKEKAKKFPRGLRADVSYTFRTERIPTVALVHDKALIAEQDEPD